MKAKERIVLKIQEIHSYLQELEDLIPQTKDEYLQNLMAKRACEKTIQLAIESVIDIMSILVSSESLGYPESEDSFIDLLVKKKILSKNVAEKVRNMKGFRNVLIHRYSEIDDSKTYEFLTKELEDFDLFEKEIIDYLKKEEKTLAKKKNK